jgi:hypothetical protein
LYCVANFKRNGTFQTLFSDGLAPHIDYQLGKLGIIIGDGIPPLIEIPTTDIDDTDDSILIANYATYRDHAGEVPTDAKLTGRIGKFNKIEKFFKYLEKVGMPMDRVAIIDDSGVNVEKLHRPVQEAGGIAIGFNVTDNHRPDFQKASIPIIKGTDLSPFYEIVRDPSKINQYCE